MVGYGEVGVSALEVEGFEGYRVYGTGYTGFAIYVGGYVGGSLCHLSNPCPDTDRF